MIKRRYFTPRTRSGVPRACRWCTGAFVGLSRKKIYCTTLCRVRAWQSRHLAVLRDRKWDARQVPEAVPEPIPAFAVVGGIVQWK